MMAEFESATQLVAAANKTREAGFVDVDAYSPIPIEELHHAIGFKSTKLPLMVLIGGLLGGTAGFSLEYWVSAIAYPLNISGRPYISWPMFIPVTFELTILFAAFAAVFGMLGLNGLPYTYLLDADGGLAYTQVGPVTSVDELRTLVAEHLGVQL